MNQGNQYDHISDCNELKNIDQIDQIRLSQDSSVRNKSRHASQLTPSANSVYHTPQTGIIRFAGVMQHYWVCVQEAGYNLEFFFFAIVMSVHNAMGVI